jgi:hypothetical protein
MCRHRKSTLASHTAVLLVALGCASGPKPVDPEALQAKIQASETEFRELATSTIEDPGRAREFIRLLDERNELIAGHARTVRQYAESLKVLNADYDASREEIERVILKYDNDRRLMQSRFVGFMTRMKAITMESEWKELSKFEMKELNPQALTYKSRGS